MKYYVKQVDPAYQKSPMQFANWNEVMYPGLVLTGNIYLNQHTVPAFDLWRNNWADAVDHMNALEGMEDDRVTDSDDYNLWYDTLRELIEDLLPPQPSRGPYSDDEIDQWQHVLEDMSICPPSEEYRLTLQALNLITNGDWKLKILRGCCQGDWQECYYDSEQYTDDGIRNIEIEYFNLGTEWIVHDEETTPQHPDEISGYSCYVYGDDYRKELSGIIGCAPADLVIYKYAGEVRKAVYELEEQRRRNIMDERTLKIFRNIAKQLNFDCGGIHCAACAFNSTDYCGMVVIKSIMAKLAGAAWEDVFQTMSDNGLIEFIMRNPQRKG